jgi:hypothetical protein
MINTGHSICLSSIFLRTFEISLCSRSRLEAIVPYQRALLGPFYVPLCKFRSLAEMVAGLDPDIGRHKLQRGCVTDVGQVATPSM